jgi:pimeloyl-ACP methyl ester carboxylesterase
VLVPVQPSGTKPPLYFIHGLTGVMPLGHFLAQSLGPDQPLYAINANGIDGREITVKDEITVKEMAHTYVEEILDTYPSGPVFIAGLCAGGLAALEVARELQARGREVGPVILADPPGVPGLVPHNQTVDSRDPLVASQLYRHVRGQLLDHTSQSYNDMPFAADDQQQVHLATLAGMNALVAFCRHVPEIFTGAAAAILSSRRAAGFFHPQMPWAKLLPGKHMAFILPYDHTEIFRSGRHDFTRVLKFILDGAMNFGTRTESTVEVALRSAEEFAHELD